MAGTELRSYPYAIAPSSFMPGLTNRQAAARARKRGANNQFTSNSNEHSSPFKRPKNIEAFMAHLKQQIREAQEQLEEEWKVVDEEECDLSGSDEDADSDSDVEEEAVVTRHVVAPAEILKLPVTVFVEIPQIHAVACRKLCPSMKIL
jgi:hypothetical protein